MTDQPDRNSPTYPIDKDLDVHRVQWMAAVAAEDHAAEIAEMRRINALLERRYVRTRETAIG